MSIRMSRILLLTSMLVFGANAAVHALAVQSRSETDRKIWPEFVSLMKSGKIGEGHVRPAYSSASTLLGFLETMRGRASWAEWECEPEVYRVGSLIHFVVQLSESGKPSMYTFTFLTEGTQWFLQHFESIVVRLDKLDPLPVSTFPDIAEDKKIWMRQENYWSQMVVLFRKMRAVAGAEAAFNMFKDGQGYVVQAKTWVPLVPAARAFILYLCWEQSRLHGNGVTLERLEEHEAVVVLDSLYFRLYRQTGHLRRIVTEEEYGRIFETIWRDRATAAEWKIQFAYDGSRCTLLFTR